MNEPPAANAPPPPGALPFEFTCERSHRRLRHQPAQSAGLVLLDPPYSEHTQNNLVWGAPNDGSQEVDLEFPPLTPDERWEIACDAARIAQRWVVIFTDQQGIGGWSQDLELAGLRLVRVGTFHKPDYAPQRSGDRPAQSCEAIMIAHRSGDRMRWNGGGHDCFWSEPRDKGRIHKTQKPLKLIMELVRLFSDPGELVVDTYAGSCTTGIACLRLGRGFIGCEQDPVLYGRAQERIFCESPDDAVAVSHRRARQLTLAV